MRCTTSGVRWTTWAGRSKGQQPNETRQIQHLLSKVAPSAAADLVNAARTSIEFFQARNPIERMDKRSASRPIVGDAAEGAKAQKLLRNGSDEERLGALGTILYMVRSNLVHGSKMDQGDDEQVISKSVPGLEAILSWAIELTRSETRGA